MEYINVHLKADE